MHRRGRPRGAPHQQPLHTRCGALRWQRQNGGGNGCTPMGDKDKEDESGLFLAAIGPVRKLTEKPLPPATPRPRPRARMAEVDEANAREAFRLGLDDAALEAEDAL